jgi:hypothetical protein
MLKFFSCVQRRWGRSSIVVLIGRLRRCVLGFMAHCMDCVCWSSWYRSGTDWSSAKPCSVHIFLLCCCCFASVLCRCLQVAFNSCIRNVFNIRRYEHFFTCRDELLACVSFWVLLCSCSFVLFQVDSDAGCYLFADLLGARSVRTSNFIFPSVCQGSTVLVREFW